MICLSRTNGTQRVNNRRLKFVVKKEGRLRFPPFFYHFTLRSPGSESIRPSDFRPSDLQTSDLQTSDLQTFRPSIASLTLSGVNGTLNRRAPVASKIALPTAAPTAMMAGSPPP